MLGLGSVSTAEKKFVFPDLNSLQASKWSSEFADGGSRSSVCERMRLELNGSSEHHISVS